MALSNESTDRGVRLIELAHENWHNPFSEALENEVKASLARAQEDAAISAVVVTGGAGRSWSAGGDFNEVQHLSGGDDVDRWIDRVTERVSEASAQTGAKESP
jgi:carboxymethylproline synthase